MKNLITPLILCIGLSVNAQIATNGTNNSGTGASAIGVDTEASGGRSTAMGIATTASGYSSTAMGKETTASDSISTAMGYKTTASGFASTAMGVFTTASDYASTVIGHYNSSGSTETSATIFNTANTAFVIGNGTDDSNRSDAFKVMFNGDTYVSNSLYLGGTEITSTAAELNLLSGVTSLGTGILEPVTENGNTGVRLSSSDASTHGDIGRNAVDLSFSGITSLVYGATGQNSVAMGISSTASGYVSTAIGLSTTASERGTTAMGVGTTANGDSSTAMGNGTTANGDYSTAMGFETKASGFSSTAMGEGPEASGITSTAMGVFTTASGLVSTAMGERSTASGDYSTAMGYYSTASDYASLVVGRWNSSGSSATSADSFSTSAPAFVIGNGTGSSSRSDAFKVMFNGDATVSNDLMVNGDVTVSSDARLKANIVSLGATLSKLLNIDGKTYTIKKNGAQKIGVLAQDIQEVFPELVSEDNEGMLSVNYQGLIPVLINALKEQEAKFQAQEERLQAIERVLFKE